MCDPSTWFGKLKCCPENNTNSVNNSGSISCCIFCPNKEQTESDMSNNRDLEQFKSELEQPKPIKQEQHEQHEQQEIEPKLLFDDVLFRQVLSDQFNVHSTTAATEREPGLIGTLRYVEILYREFKLISQLNVNQSAIQDLHNPYLSVATGDLFSPPNFEFTVTANSSSHVITYKLYKDIYTCNIPDSYDNEQAKLFSRSVMMNNGTPFMLTQL